jgi:hypothetical protein
MTADLRSGLQRRLTALRAERDEVRRLLADLAGRQARLLDRLLLLDGAVGVLEEELSGPPDGA